MKKTFQKVSVTVAAGVTAVLTEKLRNEYAKCTGFFIVPVSTNHDLQNVSIQLKIAGYEILPIGTDSIIAIFNGEYPLCEAKYDFSADNIPAKSNDAELTVTSQSASSQTFNAYFILEN